MFKITGSLNGWAPIIHKYMCDIIGVGSKILYDRNEDSNK